MKVVKFKFMLTFAIIALMWSGFSYAAATEGSLLRAYIKISGAKEEVIHQGQLELGRLQTKARNSRLDEFDRATAEVAAFEKEIEVLEAENEIATAKLTYLGKLHELGETTFEDIDDDTKGVVLQTRIQTELKKTNTEEIEELRSKIEVREKFIKQIKSYKIKMRGYRENYKTEKEKNSSLCRELKSILDENKKIKTLHTKISPALRVLQYEEDPMTAFARATGISAEQDMKLVQKLQTEAQKLQERALVASQLGNEELANELAEKAMNKFVQAKAIYMTIQMRAQGGGSMMSQGGNGISTSMRQPSLMQQFQPMLNPHAQGQFMFDGSMPQTSMFPSMGGSGFPQMPMMGQGGVSLMLPGNNFGGTSFNTGGAYTQGGAPGSFQMGWDSNPWQSQFNFGLSRPNKYMQDVYQNGIAHGLGMPDSYGNYQTTEFGFLRPDQDLL